MQISYMIESRYPIVIESILFSKSILGLDIINSKSSGIILLQPMSIYLPTPSGVQYRWQLLEKIRRFVMIFKSLLAFKFE